MKYVDTVKELLFVYAVLVLIGAAVYAHLEETTYLHAVWWACVTALTVGYGDMYPATLGGKIIAVVLMHASVLFILPLLIGNICSLCVKNQNEFTHLEQEEIKQPCCAWKINSTRWPISSAPTPPDRNRSIGVILTTPAYRRRARPSLAASALD